MVPEPPAPPAPPESFTLAPPWQAPSAFPRTPSALPQTSIGALTGTFTAFPPRSEPFPLVIWVGSTEAEAIAVPGMANAALNIATFITEDAHGDIFITASVFVMITHLHRLAGVPEAGCPVP